MKQGHRQENMLTKPPIPVLLFGLLLILLAAVYAPGMGAPWLLDDVPNLVDNYDVQLQRLALPDLLQAVLSTGSTGPTGRPLSTLSFALNFLLWGEEPYSFHVVNLVLHGINGLLVYALIIGLLGSQATLSPSRRGYIALLCSALWLVHPIQASSVLYTVQRMNLLSALFCLAGMVAYVHGRRRQEAQGRHQRLLWFGGVFICPVLAIFSKENGVLLPLYLVLIEFFFFQQSSISWLRRLWAPLVMLLIPSLLLHLSGDSDSTATTSVYPFTAWQRLLTQGRILWEYMGMILLPAPSKFSLFMDHMNLHFSRDWLHPPWSVPAWLGLAGLAAAALVLRRHAPPAAFGMAFFLAGHSIESGFVMLELMFEHRNYLPSLGLLLPPAYYLLSWQATRPGLTMTVRCLAPCLVVMFTLLCWQRTVQWGGSPLQFFLYQLQHRPDSPRLHGEIATIYAQLSRLPSVSPRQSRVLQQKSMEHYETATNLAVYVISPLLNMMNLSGQHRMPPRQEWYAELQHRVRHGQTLTPAAIGSIAKLLRCRMAGTCYLDTDVAEVLMEAVLANPHLHPQLRGTLYYSLAPHYLLYYRDPRKSLRVIKQWLALPGWEFPARNMLVQAYLASGRPDLALEQVDYMKKHFWLRRHTRRFIDLEHAVRETHASTRLFDRNH